MTFGRAFDVEPDRLEGRRRRRRQESYFGLSSSPFFYFFSFFLFWFLVSFRVLTELLGFCFLQQIALCLFSYREVGVARI